MGNLMDAATRGSEKQRAGQLQKMQYDLIDAQTTNATAAAGHQNALTNALQGDIALANLDREIYGNSAFQTARAIKLYADQLTPAVKAVGGGIGLAGLLRRARKPKNIKYPKGFRAAGFNPLTGEIR